MTHFIHQIHWDRALRRPCADSALSTSRLEQSPCSDPAQRNGDHITWEGDPRYAFYGYTHQYTGNPPHNIVDILNRGWLDWRSPP